MENLYATQHLANRLADHSDRQLVEAFVEAFGNIESLIRNQPNDHPMINAGPLENRPITKGLVNRLESAMPRYVVRSDLVVALAAGTIVALREVEDRLTAVESNG